MKYVIFTFSFEGAPIALKLKEEGNEVILAVVKDKADLALPNEKASPEKKDEQERRMSTYDGMIKKADARKVLDFLLKVPENQRQDYFLFFDFNHCFRYAERLAPMGFHGNFPTMQDRMYEEDRNMAKEFVKKHYPDIKIGEVHEFKNRAEGVKFLKDTKKLWALKPVDSDALTVVPETDDPELAKMKLIGDLEKDPKYDKGFILEQKIIHMAEFTPQKVWYNGTPIYTNIDIENKRIGSGNIGRMTGCSQDLVFQTAMDAYINGISFPPVLDEIARAHKGMFVWDISLLMDLETGELYMGEFCPNRVGYNAIYTELGTLDRISDYFEKMVKEENPFDGMPVMGSSVRFFQLGEGKLKDGVNIYTADMGGLWIMDAKTDKKQMMTAGYTWDIAVATGRGDDIEGAAIHCYENAKKIICGDAYYRYFNDYLSEEYETSIVNRYNVIQQFI